MWKRIPNLQPYEAHPDGRIRNGKTLKVLTPQDDRGYLKLRIRGRQRRVHRLIALTFIPCPGDPDEYDVDHKDFDKHNNAVSNLRWLPKLQNAVRQPHTREETLRKYFRI